MAAIMTPGAFQRLLTPIVTEVADAQFTQRVGECDKFIKNKKGQPYEFHNASVMYGFGNAPIKNPGESIAYDQAGLFYSINFYYQTRALAFALTQEMIDDGKANVDLMRTLAEQLVMSLHETIERDKANMLNLGFNPAIIQNGGDQQPLFSVNHPGISTPNQANTFIGATLSQASLEQMMILIRKTTDPRGKYIELKPQTLIVAPDNQFQADVLLNSILRSDVSTNAINPLNQYMDGYQVVSRLTSPVAWFCSTGNYRGDGLTLFHRGAAVPSSPTGKEGDFDTDTLRCKIDYRYVLGYGEWRSMFGNPGV